MTNKIQSSQIKSEAFPSVVEPTTLAKTAAQWVILFIATFAFLAACFYAADKEADAVEKQAIERKANIEKHSAIVGGVR